jgi:hypothetical protein
VKVGEELLTDQEGKLEAFTEAFFQLLGEDATQRPFR